jgi:hypothetical protein
MNPSRLWCRNRLPVEHRLCPTKAVTELGIGEAAGPRRESVFATALDLVRPEEACQPRRELAPWEARRDAAGKHAALCEKHVDGFVVSSADGAPLLKTDIALVMRFAPIGGCDELDHK